MTHSADSHRILVGVDGSAPADAAIRWAVRRAEREGAQLVAVHVVDDAFGDAGAAFVDEARRAGAELLAGEVARIAAGHPGVAVSERIASGGLAWSLRSLVAADDLLVIGTHKTGFLHGRVLGSRSVQVAAAVPCSVAVVPDVDLRFRRGVVAGIDRAATAPTVARVAAVEAADRGDELLLLQAVPRGVPGAEARGVHDSEAITVAVRAAREVRPSLVVRARVAHRDPAEALLDASRDKALLVLGPGSLEATRSPIGSVLHDVLLNVTAPVLVARPAAERRLAPVADARELVDLSNPAGVAPAAL